MTKRKPVSAIQNIWFDTEQVDNTDLSLEQDYNNAITSGIINNHIGTGVLSEALEQNLIFDSQSFVGYLDGVAVSAQNQPTDNNFGNQLEIELTGSVAAGKKTIKVGIIGLDFQGNLQFETFWFKTNESQITHKHFVKVLVLLFNDFIGDPSLSMNLGGRIIIKEAKPMSLSRDPIMVSQDVEPNLFFRDFFTNGSISLGALLQSALPSYNIDTLNIFTNALEDKILLNGDVTTQIGEKFLATTNNIQKITLLLSVRNLDTPSDLAWNGDLIVSIYPLQSDIDCPTDIAPSLPIDFSPSNIPVAQISDGYGSLAARGIVLDSVPQPVDFVFSNSTVAGGNVLIPGNYYALALKRSGAANKCDILIAAGSDRTPNSRITTFTGNLWVDIPEQDLWFQVWNDAAKVSDGQAYDDGEGVAIEKTTIDPESQATIDKSFGAIQFAGGDVFRAMVAAVTDESVPVPDQSTGNPVDSRKQSVPKVTLLNSIDIANIDQAAEPLLIGAISDKNRKFYDSFSSTIPSFLHSATMAHDELLIRVVDDPTDGYRFDAAVNELVSNLLNGDFVSAKITRNGATVNYRIADAKLCSMILGDVNGDGIVDIEDVTLLNTYLGVNLNTGLALNTNIVTDGYTTTFIPSDGYMGYVTQTNPFTNLFSASWQLINPVDGTVVASGTDGVLVANPSDLRLAQFTSASVDFNVIVGLVNYKLVILSPSTPENYGAFDVVSLDSVTDVLTIRKIFLTGDVLSEMLRADINGDFVIDYTDGYLLQSYVDKVPSNSMPDSIPTTYPAPSTNPYTKIGTRFNVIRFKLEKYIDRSDDYTNLTVGRGSSIHKAPDFFEEDGYYASHDFLDIPVGITIEKQLTWDDSLIVVNSQPKLVPSVFTDSTGPVVNSCLIDGIQCTVYGEEPEFEKGKVDVFAPDDIILGDGELKRPNGDFYKVDFEIGTIVLEIPDGLFGSERTINIMDDFISDYTGNGVTRLGFPAMKFADCSYVQADSLANDQVRFSVAVQSFSPNTDGYSIEGYSGAIVDGKMGVAVDYDTGLLTINFTNLYQDATLQTLSTKIQVTVYLKKGAFNNAPLFVDSTKVQNMLQLISVFSGANVGGPSALVNLQTDITDVLPIVHGGTGLNSDGYVGQVLMSNGSGLSYEYVGDGYYIPGNPSDWTGSPPTTIAEALDRIAAALGPIA